jgi:hypothetical protein
LHEPLVDELFEKAQQILGRRGEDASLRRGNPSEFLLSGLERLRPLRPGLRRHLRRRPQQPLHLLRLLDPLQVRLRQVPRRAPVRRTGSKQPSSGQLAELYRDGRLIE